MQTKGLYPGSSPGPGAHARLCPCPGAPLHTHCFQSSGLWEPHWDLSHPPRWCCSQPALWPRCQDTPRLPGAEQLPGHPCPCIAPAAMVTGCDLPGGTAPPHPHPPVPPQPQESPPGSALPQLPHSSSALASGARQGQQSNSVCVLQGCSPSPACWHHGLTAELEFFQEAFTEGIQAPE